jgi:PatG C-terminal
VSTIEDGGLGAGPLGEASMSTLTSPPAADLPRAAMGPTNQPACGNCGRGDCPTCGPAGSTAPMSAGGFVYALGRIEARYPNESVEREVAQATGRAETAGLADREATQSVLSAPENFYIARQLCWVLTIQSQLAYMLVPRDSDDVKTLVNSLRPTPRATDVDAVIGSTVGIAPPSMCNGLQLPMVSFAQIYSFDVDSFVESVPTPKGVEEKTHAATTEQMLDKVMQLTANAGSSAGERALNYVALRYPAVYHKVAEMAASNHSWTVDMHPSRLSGARALVDVIFSFRDRQTDVVEKYFACVDVTELFPYLKTKLSPYIYDR